MPALPRLTTPLFREAASRLHYVPAEAAARQLERAEALLAEVHEDFAATRSRRALPVDQPARAARGPAQPGIGQLGQVYPGQWVLFRITGHQPERPVEAPERLRGGDALPAHQLIADLAAFIEHLSAAAKLAGPPDHHGSRADAHPTAQLVPAFPGWFSIADLMHRWGVTRKSIERWRAKGLAGRRVATARGPRGPGRLVFSAEVVARFERLERPPAHDTVPAAARLSAREREVIVRRAQSIASRAPSAGISEISMRIAGRLGRSREIVRRTLRDHERATGSPITRSPNPQVPTHPSRASGYRHDWERRLEVLASLSPPPVDAGPTFMLPDADSVLLAPAPVRSGLHAAWPAHAARLLALSRDLKPPDAQTELARAIARQFLLWRAQQLLVKLPKPPLAARIERVETDLLWAARLERELIRAHWPLIDRTIQSTVQESRGSAPPGTELSPGALARVLEAALHAAAEGVARHDPFRGGRIASPISLAVGRAVTLVFKAQKGVLGGAAKGVQAVSSSQPGLHTLVARWANGLEPRPDIRRRAAAIGGRMLEVASLRYGWPLDPAGPDAPIDETASGNPLTSAETAERLSTTVTRIRTIERELLAAPTGHP